MSLGYSFKIRTIVDAHADCSLNMKTSPPMGRFECGVSCGYISSSSKERYKELAFLAPRNDSIGVTHT